MFSLGWYLHLEQSSVNQILSIFERLPQNIQPPSPRLVVMGSSFPGTPHCTTVCSMPIPPHSHQPLCKTCAKQGVRGPSRSRLSILSPAPSALPVCSPGSPEPPTFNKLNKLFSANELNYLVLYLRCTSTFCKGLWKLFVVLAGTDGRRKKKVILLWPSASQQLLCPEKEAEHLPPHTVAFIWCL